MRNLFSAKNTKTLKQETHIIRPDKEFPNALKLRYIRKLNNIVDMVYVPILKCIATLIACPQIQYTKNLNGLSSSI